MIHQRQKAPSPDALTDFPIACGANGILYGGQPIAYFSDDPKVPLQHCNLGMGLEKGRIVDFGLIGIVLNRTGLDLNF